MWRCVHCTEYCSTNSVSSSQMAGQCPRLTSLNCILFQLQNLVKALTKKQKVNICIGKDKKNWAKLRQILESPVPVEVRVQLYRQSHNGLPLVPPSTGRPQVTHSVGSSLLSLVSVVTGRSHRQHLPGISTPWRETAARYAVK